MFIREQLIRSLYDLQPKFYDEELLDIYINSPKTCRWQNWTFAPGYYTSPKLSHRQHRNLLTISRNIQMLSKYPHYEERVNELKRGARVYLAYCGKAASYQDIPADVREMIDDVPEWGTRGT